MSRLSKETRWSRRLLGGLINLPPGEWIIWNSWIGLLLVLEMLGHRLNGDWQHVAATVAVLAWTTVTFVLHQAHPLRLVLSVRRLIPRGEWWRRKLGLDWGVDLRRLPPIRRGLPQAWVLILRSFGLLCLLVAGWVCLAPDSWRTLLSDRIYLAFLLPRALLLGVAPLLVMLQVFLIWAEIHDHAAVSYLGQGPRPLRGEVLTTLGCCLALLLASIFGPASIPLAGMLIVLTFLTGCLWWTNRDLVLVWRQEWRARQGSFDGRLLIWLQTAVMVGLLVSVLLLLGGRETLWLSSPRLALAWYTPTQWITRIFAWLSLGGTLAIGYDSLRLAWQGICFNTERLSAREGRVLLLHTPDAERRPVEIACRRHLIRGLQGLFKRASRRRLPPESGLLLGLQHWFVLGLRTDAPSESQDPAESTVFDGRIGRPFHLIFDRQTRFHYWQICQSLQIDLIYLDRAVSFRQFVRVLRQMFEIYDMHGGQVRAEERHFLGLPAVRVLFHELDAGIVQNTRASDSYREPEYRELDRARVLHVFRDRQQSEVEDPVPVESNWQPDQFSA
ncbi:MAG: hypothetical protein ACKOFW_01655 [Planctomycetaceae bacterium]